MHIFHKGDDRTLRYCRATASHYLDEDIDVVRDLESHHLDLVLITDTKLVADIFSRTSRAQFEFLKYVFIDYLFCLQSISRLSLQCYTQLSDVNLQASGKVL